MFRITQLGSLEFRPRAYNTLVERSDLMNERREKECVTFLDVRAAAMFPRTWPRGDTLQATSRSTLMNKQMSESVNERTYPLTEMLAF